MKLRITGILLTVLLLTGCSSSRLSVAEHHVKRGEYNEAIRAYLAQIEPHVTNGRAMVYYDRDVVTGLGEVYWLMQKYETAATILERVLKRDPFFGKANYLMGLIKESLGQDAEAIQFYRNYTKVPRTDAYRYVLAGRLDWLIRKSIIRDVQAALANETGHDWADFPENSVAVLYFLSQSEDPQWTPLQKGLAEMMASDLAQSDELTVVERLKLDFLMEELRLDVAGMADNNEQMRIGRLLGAKTMIKGAYLVLPDLKMTLDAGVFNAQSATFPRPTSYEGSLTKLFQMEKQLVLEIFEYFGINLPLEAREKILTIPTKDMEAFMAYCHGLDAMDHMEFEKSQQYFHKALELDPNFDLARDQLIPEKVWDLTHSQNLIRLQRDVDRFVHNIPRGGPERLIQPDEGLVNAWNRLMRLSAIQGAGFLPGADTREAFQDADSKGASILPETLGLPPLPQR